MNAKWLSAEAWGIGKSCARLHTATLIYFPDTVGGNRYGPLIEVIRIRVLMLNLKGGPFKFKVRRALELMGRDRTPESSPRCLIYEMRFLSARKIYSHASWPRFSTFRTIGIIFAKSFYKFLSGFYPDERIRHLGELSGVLGPLAY